MNQIIEAAQFAKECHQDQVRKDGEPYINHPMRVAGLVTIQDNVTEDMIMAAWLHDTVEDGHTTFGVIDEKFGHDVFSHVHWLTNASKLHEMASWKQFNGIRPSRAERKKMDREKLALASDETKIIKLADRLDNIRQTAALHIINFKKWVDFCQLYIKETKELVAALNLECGLANDLLDWCNMIHQQITYKLETLND